MIDWKDQPGLYDALSEAGHTVYMEDGKWVVDDPKAVQAFIDAYVPPPEIQKRIGVDFEGVMCSATKQDQDGLMAVMTAIQFQGARFAPTRFEFENGNALVIHLGNWQAFAATWLPFRQSFFLAEGKA